MLPYITQWGSNGTGNGQFSGLMGIAIDDSDNVYVADRNNNRNFDLHPDGKRFAVLNAPAQSQAKRDKVTFIFNFFDELRRLAPAQK